MKAATLRSGGKLLLYHTVPLAGVRFGELTPGPEHTEDPEYIAAFKWAERETGFYPLFLAVGDRRAIWNTGYQNQWMVRTGSERNSLGELIPTYRRKGDFPNCVLFAFPLDTITGGVFTDFWAWNSVLGDTMNGKEPDAYTRKLTLKRSWSRARWLRYAEKDPFAVQLLAPKLDLSKACRVWCRNTATQHYLLGLGFKKVALMRLSSQC